MHDSVHLNRVTPQNERIYLIVKTTVQLSHPAAMELVLRKRIAANIYNKQVVMGPGSAFASMSSKFSPPPYRKIVFYGVNTVDVQIVTTLAKFQSDSHLSNIIEPEDSRGKCLPLKDFSTLTDLRPIIPGGSGAVAFHCLKRVKCQVHAE